MNAIQKGLLAAGLAAIAFTSFRAPYRVEGYNFERQVATGVHEDIRGTVYAPVWSAPVDPAIDPRARVTGVMLDSGRLLVWWVLLAIVTGTLVAVVRRNQRPVTDGTVHPAS